MVTAIVQSWLSLRAQTKARSFQERKEAYIGLLEAWVRQENDNFSEMSLLDVGHWVLRAELVASAKVFSLLKTWQETLPGSMERKQTTDAFKAAMRQDLR
ncbi:hypothetical protein K3552_14485 [Leisingera aquaemixtae]|uniref:hypothetical protein n=1 Tax=Leisingera aquaemixtae TaxID=1396826 RepID=UPI0021A35C5E|nr:hypothetical protein [Leisingera aquaemixtae]UWQ36674.1 hypothetical protein K3552_14485 [Leisingera aquaemixtae]